MPLFNNSIQLIKLFLKKPLQLNLFRSNIYMHRYNGGSKNMEILETLCKMYGIIGLVYCEESERFICINGKILYNKETGIITLLS